MIDLTHSDFSTENCVYKLNAIATSVKNIMFINFAVLQIYSQVITVPHRDIEH